MTVRDIVYWPDKKLREQCEDLSKDELESDAFLELVEDMYETMNYYQGIGLSAPQIGLNKKLFIISGEVIPNCDRRFVIFANPTIVDELGPTEAMLEGCLSFPNTFIPIQRHPEVLARCLDIVEDKVVSVDVHAKGLYAQAIQHEYDHLTGKLMVDYAGRLKKEMIKKRMKKFKERLREYIERGDGKVPEV